MGKEVDRKGEQGTLSNVFKDLEAKNQELGGRLCATIGSGRHKVLVFPVPLLRQDGDKEVKEFLAVTVNGDRVIQVWKKTEGIFNDARSIGDMIEGKLGKKPGFFRGRGYFMGINGEFIHIINGFSVDRTKASIVYDSLDVDDPAYRLVDVDKDRVEHLLQTNIEIVSREKASQALRVALSEKAPLLAIR